MGTTINLVRRTGRWAAAGTVGLLLVAGATACGGKDNANTQATTGGSSTATGEAKTFSANIGGTTAPGSTGAEAASPTPADAAAGSPTPSPYPQPAIDAGLVRMVIPSARVNAPLQIKGVNARNEMENPDGKDNVAWYNFSGRPGFESNAVFSGHVDWYTGEAAVFWGLRDVKIGDEIIVRFSDGTDVKYRVTENVVYKLDDAPVAEIVGPSAHEVVTLITCDGVFDRSAQEYDRRRVVRAERFA